MKIFVKLCLDKNLIWAFLHNKVKNVEFQA